MSDAFPVPAPRASAAPKILLGCAIGCAAVIVLFVVGAAVLYQRVAKPIARAAGEMAEAEQAAGVARAKLVELDAAHPSVENDADTGALVLTAEDVDRYVAVRLELAEDLARFDAARALMGASLASPGAGPNPSARDALRMASGALRGSLEIVRVRAELLGRSALVLEQQALGPERLGRLVEIVEWRFLRRPEALELGLPRWRRSELGAERLKLQVLEPWLARLEESPGFTRAEEIEGLRAQAADARRRVEELTAEASANVELAPATLALLESRRAELEALPPVAVDALAALTSDSLGMAGFAGPAPAGPE